MKITLNLAKLLKDGSLTQQEADRLILLSRKEDSSHAWGILTVLAVIAVTVGLIGINFEMFSQIALFLYEMLGSAGLHFLVLISVCYGSYKAKSGFLAGISAFVILSFLGSSTFYSSGSYFVSIREPALTVIFFSFLAIGAVLLSKKLQFEDQRLLLIFSRTSLILVNMGFWVGSLWGSKLGSEIEISYNIFSIIWAVGLLAVGFWGAREGRRFVVNTTAVFGCIHLYTQWFERFGASPGSLLIAGVAALAIIYGFRTYNRR